MPAEDRDLLSDKKQLFMMKASVNDARDIVRHTQELIKQSRSMLDELVVLGVDGRPTS